MASITFEAFENWGTIHSVVGKQFVASFKTCQRSFLALKKAIANASGLSNPCYDQQLILETDASDFAIGALFCKLRFRVIRTCEISLL